MIKQLLPDIRSSIPGVLHHDLGACKAIRQRANQRRSDIQTCARSGMAPAAQLRPRQLRRPSHVARQLDEAGVTQSIHWATVEISFGLG